MTESAAPQDGYRVVDTSETAAGLSTIGKERFVPVDRVPDGRGLARLWEADGVLFGPAPDSSVESPLFPAAAGVRFWTVTVPPEAPGTQPPAEFHSTNTLDVGIVLSGRIVLEMEDGTSTELSAGQAFAQQGTPHNWRNLHTEDAVIAVVMMGWDR
ncbi:cupin domain-containing protein [Kribbella sp. NBC_01505]|uniref:cupin domain-containing protein n=1 Tax=Kribbella sp. NBC_01505 TaxID=2903580 RepID=UPI0038659F78